MIGTLLERQSELPRAALVFIFLLACPGPLARLGSVGERAGREKKQTPTTASTMGVSRTIVFPTAVPNLRPVLQPHRHLWLFR